jgi:RES domain-containing protein
VKPIVMGPGVVFYRNHTPKWAHQPTSGMGSALNGGRFNRPNVEALYLASDPETAAAEYHRGSSLLRPCTQVAYHVEMQDIVEIQNLEPAEWDGQYFDWACNWQQIARVDLKDPPSWKLGDLILSSAFVGILFPSMRQQGGKNLVIYCQKMDVGNFVRPHDPENDLPKNQEPWET